MKEPIIGLLGSRLVMPGAPFPGLERDYINHDYVEALRAAGASADDVRRLIGWEACAARIPALSRALIASR